MKGVFVTGTDTDVGKTTVSAWLVRSWGAEYWKPVQTGGVEIWDARTVRRLVPDALIHPSTYTLSAPLSPHQAAQLEGITIDLGAFTVPAAKDILVVEGAGGALVPLNTEALMTDLMERVGFPVLVVARSGLGTINHTLLTLEALRQRDLEIAGVIMNGPPDPANRRAIEHFGRTRVLGELPFFEDPAQMASHPPAEWRP